MIIIELDEKLLIAKTNDNIRKSRKDNKIVSTEFFNKYMAELVEKELKRNREENYIFYGGYEEAEYKILIIYPDKVKKIFQEFKDGIKEEYGISSAEKIINNILKVIRITLPKELIGKYEHRDYLSAVMKFGLSRNRMGDIVCRKDGADIIILKENAEYIKSSLSDLIRFKKSNIEILNIKELKLEEKKFKVFSISISSNRLDNFVSEIAKVSRSKTEELIEDERIFINSKLETKCSKELKEKDVITIRGKGKFIINNFNGTNRKGKMIVNIFKYI